MTPFELIARKQAVGREYADEVELYVLCHFDAAKRGRCTGPGFNFVSQHLVMAFFIGARLKSAPLMAVTQAAGEAWNKAGNRQTECADLTTGEYAAMRAGLRAYFRALPKVEAGTYREACNVADRVMQ